MRDPKTGRYISKVEKIKTKKALPKTLEDMTKQELLRRIRECMTRVWGKIPDIVISENWNWDKFKAWISEPFIYLHYEEYDDSKEI